MDRVMPPLVVAILALLAAACAGREVRDERAVYERHAGEPVAAVNVRDLRSWSVAAGEWVLIETRHRAHYLLGLEPGCAPELAFTQKLALDRESNFRLRARFDHIELVDRRRRCRIETIRPLDHEAVRRDLDQVDG